MNRPVLRLLVTVVTTGALLAAAACAKNADASLAVRPLSGHWAFHPGDDPAWAAPAFDDRAWTRLHVPGSWKRQGFPELTGMAWYRLRVPSPWPADEALGVTLGKIDSAYELYAGGRRVGGAARGERAFPQPCRRPCAGS